MNITHYELTRLAVEQTTFNGKQHHNRNHFYHGLLVFTKFHLSNQDYCESTAVFTIEPVELG